MTGIGKIPRGVSGYSAFAFTRTRHIARISFSKQRVILGAGDGVNVQQKSPQINCGQSYNAEESER
jgi:hypothetical protein